MLACQSLRLLPFLRQSAVGGINVIAALKGGQTSGEIAIADLFAPLRASPEGGYGQDGNLNA
jgi:hypothetical protein